MAGYISSRKRFLFPIFVICIAIVLFYGLVLGMFLKNAIDFTTRGQALQENFRLEQNDYIPLTTIIFDRAQTTNVRADIDSKYGSLLSNEYGSRRPVYFIRLKENKIQKLFQSGEIKYENIDTQGERKVAEMLEGKKDPNAFPQYSCCSPNDIWVEIFPFNFLLPERRYLKDFPSELETILLIKDKDEVIKGALVDLHGD